MLKLFTISLLLVVAFVESKSRDTLSNIVCGVSKMGKANDVVIELAEWSVAQFAKHVNGYQTAELQRIRNITSQPVRYKT